MTNEARPTAFQAGSEFRMRGDETEIKRPGEKRAGKLEEKVRGHEHKVTRPEADE
jgi:hypothetical protein